MTSKKSMVLLAAYACLTIAVVLVVIAFATPYWLEADPRLYSMPFQKMGLWQQCFRSIYVGDPAYGTYFTGCRWIFNPWTTDYHKLRAEFIEQPFFIAVQVLFTICLALALLGCLLVFLFAFCLSSDRQVCMLCCISFVMFCSALFGTISVIVFGAMGDGRHWMPYPEHNYLSWSFALAVIGSFFAWVAALLFWIEAKRTRRHIEKAEIYAMHGTSKA